MLNKDIDIVLKESPLIILDIKSDVCIDKNGKDTKHTRQIFGRVICFRNGKKFKIHKIDWCQGGLQLAYIATKKVRDINLNTRTKYIMVRLDNLRRTIVQEGWQDTG